MEGMKGKKIIVSGQRVINLGNYRSLHLGGSIEIDVDPDETRPTADLWADAEKAYLRRLNEIADGIEDQVHK
jgi:hypothetical protein